MDKQKLKIAEITISEIAKSRRITISVFHATRRVHQVFCNIDECMEAVLYRVYNTL